MGCVFKMCSLLNHALHGGVITQMDIDLNAILHNLEDSQDAIDRNKELIEKYGVDYDDDDADDDE